MGCLARFEFSSSEIDKALVQGRQEPQSGARSLDQVPDDRGFMAAEISYDDDIAWAERRQQLLLDIGAEANSGDRPVETQGAARP